MLNIEGLVKITKFEDLSEKSVKATIYFGTKRKNTKSKDDEWENSFFNAVLVGKAVDKSMELEEKQSIYITSGLVKNVSYQDKEGKNRSYLSVTIFDFEYDEQVINKLLEESKKGSETKKEEKKKRERNKR